MKHALLRLTSKSKFHGGKIVSGWQYALARKYKSGTMSGNKYSKGRKHTKESRLKMSDAWTKRKPVSDEMRAKQSASKLGNFCGKGNNGVAKTEEWEIQMSGGGNWRAKGIICLSDGLIFECILDASKFYKI